MISIITPIRNGNKYLETYINSIKCQTDKNFELIIVNDGSTDGVEEYLEKVFSDFIFFKLINQKALGIVSATVNGIKNASGEYISFVDSDDIISKDYVSDLNRIISERNSDIICFKNFSYIEYPVNVHDSEDIIDLSASKNELMYDFFVNAKFRTLSEKIIKKELFDFYGDNLPFINVAADVFLSFMPLYKSKIFTFYDKTMYFAPKINVSTSKSYIQNRRNQYESLYNYIKKSTNDININNYNKIMFLEFLIFNLSIFFFNPKSDKEIKNELNTLRSIIKNEKLYEKEIIKHIKIFKKIIVFLIDLKLYFAIKLLLNYIIVPQQKRKLNVL